MTTTAERVPQERRSTISSAGVRRTASAAVPHAVLLVACFLAVAPFVWSFLGSFKSFRELISSRDILPRQWTFANYEEIITRAHFPDALWNSVLVSTIVTVASLFTSSALGYIFAKYRFPGRDLLFGAIISTMFIPFVVTLVPLYITMANLGLVNHLGGITIVGLWTALGVFMMRQFMMSIPDELIDAAHIDGAGEWQVYFRIILPLAKAPLAALGILVFLGAWDSFLWPSIILTSTENQTLPLLLNGLKSLYWSRFDLWSAGSMLTVIPVMIVYLFASKYFIRGIAMSGLKG